MVKQANENDIPIIEEILLDAVHWMSQNGLQNQWNEANIKWSVLAMAYKITDFYIHYQNDLPTACMALTDYDPAYWPELSRGEALYLHKLAVKRSFAGNGYAKELIDYAKTLAFNNRIKTVRLNCNQHRAKLREVYEREGFVCVEEKSIDGKYDTALYVYDLSKY